MFRKPSRPPEHPPGAGGQAEPAGGGRPERPLSERAYQRMRQSGRTERLSDDDEEADRTHLLVRDVRPPFLRGLRVSASETQATVVPVKDPTSDMAVLAAKGSAVVRLRREQRERIKSVEHLRVAGSTLGNLLGIQREEDLGDDELEQAVDPADEKEAAAAAANARAPERARSLREQREFLPIFAVREQMLQVVQENQIVVIVGETGSGKTTQLTQYLYEAGYTRHGRVACTQPRRVAATSVAQRVALEVGCELGGTVGYAIRFEDRTSDKTRIKYMTDGILVREAMRDRDLDAYSVVVMDEAHERALQTDVLMGLLRRVVTRRRDLKLIVTSATMDAGKFARYFGNVPVFAIPGRTFPVDVLYARSVADDYVAASVKQVLAIHLASPPGDVLVFMTGQEDIEATCALLEERVAQLEDVPPVRVLPIYSQLPAELQARVFESGPRGVRKVVVATNIAETSLTLDGVAYVVDAGYCKLKVYNPKIGMDTLRVFPVGQANAMQRSGRAGRTGPGTCFRMYTEMAFKHELLPATVPEIQRTNLANVVLLLKTLRVDNVLEFGFMDPPPRENVLNSMYQLWTLGALDALGELTPLGRRMADFPLDPALAKMLLAGADAGCAAEMATIVSMLSVPNVFYRPRERAEAADAAREKFFVPESDHLTLLHVYGQWLSHGARDGWCHQHFLLPRAMRRAREVREQLVDIMRAQELPLVSCGSDWDVIRRCVCSAYFHHAGRLKAVGEYVNLRTSTPCSLHPTSALFGLGYTPDYVVYHELVLTSKPFMRCVSAVDPRWLAELGPMFFALKHTGYGHAERRQQDRELDAQLMQQLAEAERAGAELAAASQGDSRRPVAAGAVTIGRKRRRAGGVNRGGSSGVTAAGLSFAGDDE